MAGSANRNGITANAENDPTPEKAALGDLAQRVRQLIEEVSLLKRENRRLARDLAAATMQLQDARAESAQLTQPTRAETEWTTPLSDRLVLRERLLRLLEKIELELQRYNS